MKIYLVGGAIRDRLMGRPVKERDWVVVGSTPGEMEAQGFRPVGKDFPVFLHPKTHEEYALARTERKSGKGYKGFVCYAEPDVSLEEDLKRRDLTINAMAETAQGEIIDPYGGQQDLQKKVLRHVSPAFIEDPLRVLRVARFAARYDEFFVHPETLQLMREMTQSGELNELVPERVWVEMVKALSEPFPWRFFEVLGDCSALSVVFPEIGWSNEAEKYLKRAVKITHEVLVRFAVLMYTITGLANKLDLKEVFPLNSLLTRLHAPSVFFDLASVVYENYDSFLQVDFSSFEALLNLLEKLDAFRKTDRFKKFLLCCEILNDSSDAEEKIKRLKLSFEAAAKVRFTPNEQEKNLTGLEIARWMHVERCKMIAMILNIE